MQYYVYELAPGYRVMDVQSDWTETPPRVVAPLLPVDNSPPMPARFEPILDVDGTRCVLHAAELAAVPTRVLKQPIADLSGHHDQITRALDIVFHGF
ncbi:MAG: CcdB family protein [Pseudomonadota bacterium]